MSKYIKRILVFSCALIFLFSMEAAFALDWKYLHEEADMKTLKQAQGAVSKKPGSLDDLYVLGLVYLTLHRKEEAMDVFEKIIAIDPGSIEGRWGKAEVLRRNGWADQSQEILNKIIAEEAAFAPARITLAYIKYTQLDFEGAITLSEQVLQQGRKNVDLSNYTRAYLIIGGSRGMLAQSGGPFAKIFHGMQIMPNLAKAESLQPDSAAVLFGLGSFYFLAPHLAGGSIDKAMDYLQRAIKADPLLADAYVRLAQLYKIKGDNVRARDNLKRALEIDPINTLAQDAASKKCKFACLKF